MLVVGLLTVPARSVREVDSRWDVGTMVRLMVVDDNLQYRRLLSRLLEQAADMRVVGEAANGNEAIARARRLAPDVVLMDLELPQTDGLSAAQTITAESPSVKVVIVTANPGAVDSKQAARSGIHAVLAKGRPIADVLSAIRRALGESLTTRTDA